MIEKYGAILHKSWIAKGESYPGIIIGYWIEDNLQYEINVPEQLKDILIDIQNKLSRWWLTIEEQENRIKRMTKAFSEIFKDK